MMCELQSSWTLLRAMGRLLRDHCMIPATLRARAEGARARMAAHLGLRAHAHRAKASTYRLLDEIDAGLQVQAKVNEVPLDALPLVFFLLQDEHGVVEELLQLFIGVVDAQLLE